MTVASEIARIKTNISNAYDSAEAKGATLPEQKNSENLAECIDSITGGEPTYNVESSALIGEINQQGVLEFPTSDINIIFSGVEDIGSGVLENKFAGVTTVKSISFPDLKRVSGEDACYNMCYKYNVQSNLQSISFPELESVSGSYAFNHSFAYCPVVNAFFPKLKTVTGLQAFAQILASSGIKTINFTELETVSGESAFQGAIASCTDLEYAYFPKLKYIGENGFNQCFSGSGIKEISFPNLEVVQSEGFYLCFPNCSSLKTIYFNSLNADSFGEYTNQFNAMLLNCDGVTVHFLPDMEDVIGDWGDVISGFDGTNTTVLYDIDPCYVAINVSGSSDYQIYVNGYPKTSPFVTGKPNKEFCIYDNTNFRVYYDMLTGLVVGETTTFNANLSNANIPVNINIPSGVSLSVKYKGNEIPLENLGNGSFRFYTNGNGQEITYVLSATSTTSETSGSFILTGSEMNIQITPPEKQWVTFERPNLTADGSLGGNSFAVSSSGTYSSSDNYQAYNAVDGNTSNYRYWYSSNITNPTYTFYNPDVIKINSLTFRWTSTSYRATQVVLDGSNDGSSWSNVGTYSLGSATSVTANVGSSAEYKYYKMTFTKSGTYIRMVELTMDATVYK